MVLKLKPSEIRYSQDSINSKFSNGERLRDTLHDVCEGSLKVTDFRSIRVAHHNGNWVTTDNRRLWLFQQLERLGECGEIPVEEIDSIEPGKLTTTNEGVSIEIRPPRRNRHMNSYFDDDDDDSNYDDSDDDCLY